MTVDTRRDGSPLLESAVEGYLEKRMRQIGGRAYKFPPAVKGNPDRIVMFPWGRIYLVELKREGKKPEPAQVLWHRRAFEIGHVVHVIDSRAKVDAFIAWATAHSDTVNVALARRQDEYEAMKRGYTL